MELKVIGAGFGRTGTTSLYTALNQLGFPCYHMFEVITNPANKSHVDFWLKVANDPPGQQQDWQQVFAKYSAAVDNPACCVYRELLAAYPDAKVILTTHPGGPDAWFDSTHATIYKMSHMWQARVLRRLAPPFAKFAGMVNQLIWQRQHRGTMDDRAQAIAFYHRYIEEVRAHVPRDQLLEFSVAQGWKPLCDFLGVPVPSTPFPNTNDRAEFQARVDGVKRAAYVSMGVAAALIAGVTWGAMRFL
ncbi:MAG TPA: sulfotransferase [Nevskiaceae bacterium]|nr:sulfotransferase [Nevskiaceae bacterium]